MFLYEKRKCQTKYIDKKYFAISDSKINYNTRTPGNEFSFPGVLVLYSSLAEDTRVLSVRN